MGVTTHGIKYPEPSNLPNVPDDIGGVAKLDQTTQSWLAALDTANLASLSAMNGRCASAGGQISTLSTSITTAANRQLGQQTSVTSITSRNDNVNTRLNSRDATLASDQSTIAGFPGQLTSMATIKGRGLIGFVSVGTTIVSTGAGWTPLAQYTFNDPAPNANRIYRGFAQISIDAGISNTTSRSSNFGMIAAPGTSFPGSPTYTTTQAYDGQYNALVTVVIDYAFTGISASTWTLWLAATGNSMTSASMGGVAGGGAFLTLEDIGLQL